LKFIWNSSINILFKKRKEREIKPGPLGIKTLLVLGDSPIVDQGVVVEKQPTGDVERNEHVNAVVFMCSKDEEDAKAAEDPGESVEKVNPPGRVLGNAEVEEGDGHCVAGEHVVPTGPHSLEIHPSS